MSNDGAIKRFYHYLFGKPRHVFSDEERQESHKVRALNKEIRSMEETIDRLSRQLHDANQVLAQHREVDLQTRVVDGVMNFLSTPNTVNPSAGNILDATTPANVTTPSEMQEFSDEDLDNVLKTYTDKQLKQALAMGDNTLFKFAKKKLPSATDDTIRRGIERAKLRVGA